MTTVTASSLRADIYRILDQVLATGEPVEIERNGRRLRIIPLEAPHKLDRLVKRPNFVRGDPEDLVHLDWFDEWQPDPA
jgi:antitoxin (DNA-binding transcriptional repressor) of toxin-antitoxin stability system